MQDFLLKKLKSLCNNYVLLSVVILCLKLLIVPFTSESFDTATYLYQVKRLYDFDFIAIDNWNKSYLLLHVYILSYSAYITLLEFLHYAKDNLILFHIFFKSFLVISDFGIGVVIYKIAEHLKFTKRQKFFSVGLWLINPFVWYSAYMKGQYEIIVAFVILLSIYFLLIRKYIYSIVVLATAFAFKYVFIILLPFYFLVIIGSKIKSYNFINVISASIKYSLIYGSIFVLAYIANIITFIDFSSISNTRIMLSMHYGSVLNFIGSNNSAINIGTPTVDGPIFKIMFFLINSKNPTMDNQIYNSWQNFFSVYVFVLSLGIIYSLLTYVIIKKKETPNGAYLLYVLLTLLTTFYITQSKIEAHWYIWAMPLIILLGIYHNKTFIKFNLTFLLLVIIAIFGSGPQKFHFANLNTEFYTLLPDWALINFSNFSGVFLFSTFLFYLVYFLITILKSSKRKIELIFNLQRLSIGISAIALIILVFLYFHSSALMIVNKNINTTPINSISSARTWYYSTAIDPASRKPYFPYIASNYISYLFKKFPDVFENNFLLVIDEATYRENVSRLPKSIPMREKGVYYYNFKSIKNLFKVENGLLYINLKNATKATLMHSFDTGYAESYYFIKQKGRNDQYLKPYYINKYKSEIYLNAIIYYVVMLVAVSYLTYVYFKKMFN